MSDARRFTLCVAVACGSMPIWSDTESWLVFVARPFLVLLALMAVAPWHAES